MALPRYTRTNLISSFGDDTILANLSNQVDLQDAANKAAREVVSRVHLKGTKRRAPLTPNLFDDIYEYQSPSDLDPNGILDISPQAFDNRALNSRVRLITAEEFDRKKGSKNLNVAIRDDDHVRVLLIDIDVQDTSVVVSRFDSLTADGSNWAAYGDSSNVQLNQTNKIQGSAAIQFDLDGSDTFAGIYNAGLDAINIGTDIFNNGYAFVWAYFNSVANMTSVVIQVGQDASNYHQEIETEDAAGQSFVAGWNLIRFSWADKTTVGTVDPSAIDFVRIYINKTTGKNDNGYRFDNLTFHSGEIYNIHYHSFFPWQSSAGSYIANSTAATDYINASDADEMELFSDRFGMEVSRRVRDWENYKIFEKSYLEREEMYKRKNPDESLTLESPSGYAGTSR